ncbi:retinal maintenance-domain-containing protein [Fimicolochytrium jonesii]|uniref:retinal maintenance-domain-containing protein n=1 Tax=Fimicolochytrium jonesii TaxID=1396493 RepID=UPI0022FE02F2|nr:retinal maintenance-domain-containing protein [Fimicolochytrium jonesii]KAI8818784.1 retinal maintenance-domain-containing protein [Fimicolochytrium jonesii]
MNASIHSQDDDLDHLIASLSHDGDSHRSGKHPLAAENNTYNVDDLLDELDKPDTSAPRPRHGEARGSSESLGPKTKCTTLYIGGTSTQRGQTVGSVPRSCNRVRCVKCDFRCLAFPDATWTPDTDYLFLRNNMPDVERMQEKLSEADGRPHRFRAEKQYRKRCSRRSSLHFVVCYPHAGSVAFCCQCSWHTTATLTDVRQLPKLKWVCGGH